MVRNNPNVSVVMPVYNGAGYIAEAIESFFKQTMVDWELIIVDDGSTDATKDIVCSYSDRRIKILTSQENKGCPCARNLGMSQASGRYIAVMDADDICMPERLELQTGFLDANPDIGLLGTAFRYSNSVMPVYRETDYEIIKLLQIRFCYLRHSTCMIRRSLVNEYSLYYNERMPYAADYDWQVRAAHLFPVTNLNDVMLIYRRHENQISTKKIETQGQIADLIRLRQIRTLGGSIPDGCQYDVLMFFKNRKVRKEFYPQVMGYINTIKEKKNPAGYYDEEKLNRMLTVLSRSQYRMQEEDIV